MILILDLGSRDNTRVARAIRKLGVYSEIHAHDITLEEIKKLGDIEGLILNGGPNNIINGECIDCLPELYTSGYKLLAIDHKGADTVPHVLMPKSDDGLEAVLKDFVFSTCNAAADWKIQRFIDEQIKAVKEQTGGKGVLIALSGGVDSSVVAALLAEALGDKVVCVHVNHGLLRKGETEQICKVFGDKLGANFIYVDAQERFLTKLEGVSDPEAKRRIIGEEFIRVFEEEAGKLSDIEFLAQGTIYPDIVESGTKTVKAVKSHHNVGGLPEKMQFKLVEPLKQLFKDEVRACGMALGLPEEMVMRQPFPGPGLGVRVLGAITRDRLQAVRESDAILREEIGKAKLNIWQYFTVVPEFKSVGVRNEARTYEYPVIIRAVDSTDAMTARARRIDWEILERITERILSEVKGVNRVCYDLSPKPTATIEWE